MWCGRGEVNFISPAGHAMALRKRVTQTPKFAGEGTPTQTLRSFLI